MEKSYFSRDEIKGQFLDLGIIRRMWPFLRPFILLFGFSLFLILCGTGIQMLIPWLYGKIVDSALKAGSIQNLHKLLLIYICARLSSFVMFVIRSYSLQYIGQQVLHDMRNKLFSHLQKLPIKYFDKNPVGRLVTRVTNDVATLSELFSSAIINVMADIFFLIGIASAMIFLNYKLGLATLFTAPCLLLAAWFLKVKMREAYRKVREKLAIVNASLAENISGMQIIQIFCREKERSEKFDKLNTELRDAQLESVFYNSFFSPVVTVINAITMAIIIIFGGKMVLQNEISIGLLISYIAYAQHFFFPIRSISERISVFQNSFSAGERVFTLLDEQQETDISTATEAPKLKETIEFKHVSFAYDADKPVLKDVSFKVKKGEAIAIVGHTGAGKTTIASLLKRFYEIKNGEILIDNQNIKEYSRSALRRTIALIQQEVFIFSGSIRDNISLFSENLTQEKLDEIIKNLKMENFLAQLPSGLETEILERGGNLSAGQRQLIAFSRALAFDPEILILDEATSSVDSETERIVQEAIKTITKDRTSIIIAHRLSTIKNCDRILVLHNGKLIEEGSHQELLHQNGHYKKLYDIQFA
jgi:ATP-binding cassette subfamily B protein